MQTFRILALATAASTILAASPARADEGDPAKVVVRGDSILRVEPNVAFITLAIESRNTNPREAQQSNAKTSDAVLAKLRGAKLGEKAVRTLAYSLQEEFDYEKGERRSRGYVARNQIEVRVDDIARVGEIIDLATGSGATSVGGLAFDVKERRELERDALREAVADGRKRAQAAAAGAGTKIGRLLTIEQQGASAPTPPRPMFRGAVAMSAKAPPPPIEGGEIEISASVRITAELE